MYEAYSIATLQCGSQSLSYTSVDVSCYYIYNSYVCAAYIQVLKGGGGGGSPM